MIQIKNLRGELKVKSESVVLRNVAIIVFIAVSVALFGMGFGVYDSLNRASKKIDFEKDLSVQGKDIIQYVANCDNVTYTSYFPADSDMWYYEGVWKNNNLMLLEGKLDVFAKNANDSETADLLNKIANNEEYNEADYKDNKNIEISDKYIVIHNLQDRDSFFDIAFNKNYSPRDIAIVAFSNENDWFRMDDSISEYLNDLNNECKDYRY